MSSPYIDLTLDVMKQFQVTACRINDTMYQVPGGQPYIPGEHVVEPDLSNAGYFWAAGAITGQKIGVAHIRADSLQGDLKQIRILEKMGCDLFFENGSAAVKGRDLHAVDVDMTDTPDAVPAIAVVAAFAKAPPGYATSASAGKRMRPDRCRDIPAGENGHPHRTGG